MSGSVVACTKCNTPLANELLNAAGFLPCPACQASLQVWAFPALLRPAQVGATGERILVEGEASCFYHPQKRATIPCEACGRFLCSVCDVDLNGQHLCPSCIQSGRDKGKLTQLDTKRTIYDSIALSTAVVPLLMWPLTLISAPVAIYYAILSWKRPGSLLPRFRWRAYLALFFAGAEIVGWIVLGVIMIRHMFA